MHPVFDTVRLLAAILGAGVPRREHGQTTAEYALVLLGAAAVALLVVAWTTRSNRIGRLLDAILDSILSNVT